MPIGNWNKWETQRPVQQIMNILDGQFLAKYIPNADAVN